MKFQRQYQIQIECDDEVAIIKPPFTINFSLNRDVGSTANTLNLKILNLSQHTRQKIFQDRYNTARIAYRRIELRAGYGTDMPIIFQGNIQVAYNYREKTEWVTDITAWDGGAAFANSFSNFTLGAGTSQNAIISKLFTDMPGISPGIVSQFNGTSERGKTYFGNTTDIIQEEVGIQGNFFIDNEKAFVLKPTDAYNGTVQIINAKSGLLGTPRRYDARLDIDVLFEPHVSVGQVLQLQSLEAMYNGNYKVMGFTHQGIISEAANGELTTKLNLWYGIHGLDILKEQF